MPISPAIEISAAANVERPSILQLATAYYWKLRAKLRRLFPASDDTAWIAKWTPSAESLAKMCEEQAQFSWRPFISVILPVFETREDLLKQAIESVRSQVYPNWELCIADDASKSPHIKTLLKEVSGDERIKVVYRESNGHIAHASNSALSLATGEFIALLDHDDMLAPHALYEVVRLLNSNPELDIIYSNEDKIDTAGIRSEPTFKASWSPDYLLSFMYTGHLTVYRRALVLEVNGFRPGMEGSQDYDLLLRVSEKTSRIANLPAILYHWRKHTDSVAENIMAKPYAFEAATRALNEALTRRHQRAQVVTTKVKGIYKVQYPPFSTASDIYLFFRDGCDPTYFKKLTQPNCNLFLVNCGGAKLNQKELQSNVTVVNAGHEKNWSKLVKAALDVGAGENIILLEGGLLPKDVHCLNALLEHINREEVGAVGGAILKNQETYLHASYVLLNGVLSHRFYGASDEGTGYGARLVTVNNVSVVSTRCMATKRALLKGLDLGDYIHRESFDVALSLQIAALGKRVLFTPYAAFISSKDFDSSVNLALFKDDFQELQQRFDIEKFRDPFYPPGLSARADFVIEA